jgi:hypothetical protein
MSVLTEIWALSPDVRLGQLMSHLGFMGECYVNKTLPLLEDDEFIAILYRHRDELRARLGGNSMPIVSVRHAAISVSGTPTT